IGTDVLCRPFDIDRHRRTGRARADRWQRIQCAAYAQVTQEPVMKPLQGIRIVELGQYISAPYCAMMLADQGAEVIKVERPQGGDPRRDYDPLVRAGSGQLSGGFLSYNRNKSSVTLDMSQAQDRQRYVALVHTADVVVENLRPGAADKLGVGYEALAPRHPRLVYAAISGYGRSPRRRGPYSDRPAFDTAVQAMAGIMDVTGEV